MNFPSWLRKSSGTEIADTEAKTVRAPRPFSVLVHKEIADQVRSWRFVILAALMLLTCAASLYTASTEMRNAVQTDSATQSFFFLKLFTSSGDSLPSFITFLSFLAPLIGIGLGFDAINSERSKGTLGRIVAQPVYRDSLLNAKFVAATLVVGGLFYALGFLTAGFGIYALGIPPTPEEFWRLLLFLALSTVFVAFWLNLSILFSVRLRQAATSALAGIAVWLFFSIFYNLIVNVIASGTAPSAEADLSAQLRYDHFILFLQRLSPVELFNEATTTLLMPSVRSLGPLTQDQVIGAIPNPLPLGQSLLLVWPQVISLIALTLVCFGIAYVLFMRQEIRSR